MQLYLSLYPPTHAYWKDTKNLALVISYCKLQVQCRCTFNLHFYQKILDCISYLCWRKTTCPKCPKKALFLKLRNSLEQSLLISFSEHRYEPLQHHKSKACILNYYKGAHIHVTWHRYGIYHYMLLHQWQKWWSQRIENTGYQLGSQVTKYLQHKRG